MANYTHDGAGNTTTHVISINGRPPTNQAAVDAAILGSDPFDLAQGDAGVGVSGVGDALAAFDATQAPSGSQTLIHTLNGVQDFLSLDGVQNNAINNSTAVGTLNDVTPSLIDALSFANAIKSGKPLPIVSSGLHLANRLVPDNGGSPNYTSKGAANAASAVLSVLRLDAALKNGDTFGALTAGVQTISYGASAFASFAAGAGAQAASEIAGSIAATFSEALPYVAVIGSIISGDPVGIAVAVASLAVPVVGQIYAVFSLAKVLFSDNTPPEAWGNVQAEWSGNDAVSVAIGASGGLQRAQGTYDGLLNYLDTLAADQEAVNPGFPLGVVANRLPSISFRDQHQPGFTLTDTDPLTGEQNPVVHYDFNTLRPYDAPPGSTQASQSFSERFLRTALGRQAIAPLWEVQTAAKQTQAGDPSAGLSEEERAGRAGKLAAALPAGATEQTFRPVALDLNGDGVQTTNGSKTVEFNVDDSGFYKQTAWLNNNDGFLVLDRNLNGAIDSGKEMFSNAKVALNQRGLQGMRWVDANYDGKIDAADPVWSALKVWQDSNGDGLQNFTDLNGNGIADAGEPNELHGLSNLGISELNYSMGTFTQNGQIKEMSSPNLAADTFGSKAYTVPEGIVVETTNGEASLHVTQVDDKSVLSPNADGATGIEDTELIIDSALLLVNDHLAGQSGADLSVTAVANFTHGSGYLDSAGKVHFSPDADYFGPAKFEYTIKAATGQSATAAVNLNIQNVNDAPTLSIDQHIRAIYGYASRIRDFRKWIPTNPQYAPYNGPDYSHNSVSVHAWRYHDTPIEWVDVDGINQGTVTVSDIDNPSGPFTFQVSGQAQQGEGGVDANGNFSYTNWTGPNQIGTLSDGWKGRGRLRKRTYSARPDPFTVEVTDPAGAGASIQVDSVHSGSYTPSVAGGGKKPISIDLDGDGFAFTDVNDSSIFFDINSDGFKHRTAWPVAGDGLLAFDANGNGVVDDGSEISFVRHDANAQTDLEGLKAFDSNGDGIFSALDDKWAQFGVWQDGNQNGKTDAGELQSLNALGIASIGLNSDGQFSIINGQTVHGMAQAIKTDQSTLDIADVTLAYSDEVQVTNANGTTGTAVKKPFAPSGEIVSGTAGRDLLLGNNGNTVINGLAGADVVFASIGNDVIDGGAGNDAVYAGAGNDVTMAGSGDDVVFSGAGNDLAFGEDGHDALFGEAGNDVMFGGAGNDLLSGDDGNDLLSGDSGNDQIFAGTGNDALFGGAGHDELAGMQGNDRLDGGAGNDLLDGGTGADEMLGGAGNDTYAVDSSADAVTENFSGGSDTVRSAIDYSLGANVENLMLTGIANLNATGNALNNVVTGNAGDNTLIGGRGNDTLVGGAGDDRYIFNPGDGADIVLDGLGHDTLYLGGTLSATNLQGERIGNDAVIQIQSGTLDTTDSITLSGWFSDVQSVDRIVFSNGTFMDKAAIEALFNQPPVANPDSMMAFEDGGIVITPVAHLLANDNDPNVGDILTVESVGVSAIGAALSLVGGEIFYDIGKRFQELKSGAVVYDSFEYTINDGNGETASSVVNVTIVGTNDGPIAHVDSGDAIEDGPVATLTAAELMANDSDVDQGDTMRIAAVSAVSASGAALSLVNGDVQYDVGNLFQWLGEGKTTTDTFDYTIVDSQGATSTTTVSMTVTGTNDGPVVNVPLSDQRAFETVPFDYQMPDAAFTDIDQGDILSYSASMANGEPLPAWLTFDTVAQRFNSDMPDGFAAGIWNVRLTASDQHGASAFSDFQLDVADLIRGDDEENVISGSALRDVIYGFGDDDVLTGQDGNDVLIGGTGLDILQAGRGDDILIGGQPLDAAQLAGAPLFIEMQSGDDDASDRTHDRSHEDDEQVAGNLLDGGSGNDTLIGGSGNDMLIGGSGNDIIKTGSGADIIAFNAGDGKDVLLASQHAEHTLSLGGGIGVDALSLSKSGNDLILGIGISDQITFNDWYASADNRSVENLQIISSAFEADDGGHDDEHDGARWKSNVLAIDFAAVSDQFDASGSMDQWSLAHAKLDAHLENDDEEAVGGDLSTQYALNRTLGAMRPDNIQDMLANSDFAQKKQA
ncbi:MAG: tandem-95 repeat protein [Mariprofundaceae bacterium]